MGDEFLTECVEDLSKKILLIGVQGLLGDFEKWLYKIDAIDKQRVEEYRKIKRADEARKKEDRLFYRKRLFGAWNCVAPSGGIKEKGVRDDVVKEIRKRVKI